MKLIRLPSGPLACVYSVPEQPQPESERGQCSGVFRAFSGSVEADGPSEDQAIQALDHKVRRLSVPPAEDIAAFELSREVANDDITRRERPGLADASGRYARYSEHDTMPAPSPPPRKSSRKLG